jgi:hypothetical protein
MKKDKKDKIDLGYDTSKIIFSIGTVVGLFDSDGSFRIRIRKSNEVLRRYALELVFTQQEENRDIADSLVKTIGFGRIYLTPTKGNRKPSVSLVLNFLTSVKESLCRNWLDPFPPLAAGKRRDYLISKILSDHQRKKYTSFSEFDSNVDLKRKNVSISVAEFRNLTPVERRKAGTIACLYLKSNLSPSINKPAKVAFVYSSLKGAIARDASFFHIKK